MRIENNHISIEVDKSGSITCIEDKILAKTYISNICFSGLFRLISPVEGHQGRHADSKDQKDVCVESINESTMTITYKNIKWANKKANFDFNFSSSGYWENDNKQNYSDIICKVKISILDKKIELSMSVENRSEDTITDVIFPIVSGFGKETKNMDITWPVQTQINERIIKSPYKNLGAKNHKEWFHEKRFIQARYPHELTTSWIDYSDENGGISFEYQNNPTQVFDFLIQKVIKKDKKDPKDNKIGIYMASEFYSNILPKEKWNFNKCIIHIHSKDWHNVAKKHRKWLEKNMTRPNTPISFSKSLGWHFYLMKLQDGTDIRNYDDMPKMAQAALDSGINNIMIFGCYERGHDNDYDMKYLPNEEWGGEEKFIENIRKVKEMEVNVIPFFNGTLMETKLVQNNEKMKKFPVVGRTENYYGGQDWSRPVFDFPHCSYKGYTTTRNNMLYEVCITSKEGKKWFKDTVKRLSEKYETGNIQLDQLAHKTFVCYAKDHGHNSPQDAYTKDLDKLLKEVRDELRAYNNKGLIIGEGFTDKTASYCDAFWNWNQLRYPEIVRYSVPWMKFSCQIDALDYRETNFCFAHGILLDLKIEGGVGIVSDFKNFQKHLYKLAKLKEALLYEYALADFEDEDGIKKVKGKNIVAKVFYNEKEKIGSIIIANVGSNIEDTKIVLDEKLIIQKIYRMNNSTEKVSDEVKFKLKPYEVLAVVYKKK